MTSETLLDTLCGPKEVEASPEETNLLAKLRAACSERDAAQRQVDDLMRQVRDVQRARLRQMNND